MKKELELYELVLLLKFTATEQETISKTEFYRIYCKKLVDSNFHPFYRCSLRKMNFSKNKRG